MGLYDQLLGVTQQGLNNLGQTAQLRAQQPTFADVFMDRFRQAGQDQLARQKTLHDMALNDVYKQAQMQQMSDSAANRKLQNYMKLAEYISNTKTGENGPEVEAVVKAFNGDPSMIPQMRYQETSVDIPSESTGTPNVGNLRGSLPEDYTEAKTITGQVPIEWSGWGANAAFKQKSLDLKEQLAQMSMESKKWLAEHKALEPKDALAKLDRDYILSQGTPYAMNPQDYRARKFYLTAKMNPLATGWMGQGVVPSATVGPNMSNALPGSVQPTAAPQPSVNPPVAPPQGKPGQPPVPTVPPSKVPPANQAGEPNKKMKLNPKGEQQAAEFQATWGAAESDVNDLIKKLDEVLANPSELKEVVGLKGKFNRNNPMTSRGKTLSALIDSIKAQSGLQKIADLKKSGAGLGQVTEGEHTLVQNAGRSVDYDKLDETTLAANLAQLREKATSLKSRLSDDAKNKLKSFGIEVPIQRMTLDEYLASRSK